MSREDNTRALWAASRSPLRHDKILPVDGGNSEWTRTRDGLLKRIGSGFLVGLVGPRGGGKTQIAVHAMVHACGGGRSVLYLKTMEVFLRLRASLKPEAEKTELAVVEELTTPMLLVLDEIQVRGGTEFEDRILTHILDMRYDAMRDTIIIANLKPDKLIEEVGSSISDRMSETGGIIECNWESFRQKK